MGPSLPRDAQAAPTHLHRTVLRRLAVVCVTLSLVLGSGAVYLEMRQADALMLERAHAGSKAFVEHVGRGDVNAAEHLEALRRSAAATLKAGFASVRVYDAERRLALEVADARRSGDRPDPGSHVHDLRPGDTRHYHTHWTASGPYMQVLVPIGAEGPALGYFEGIYEVDPATARTMARLAATAAGIVAAVVFATAASLYPLIILLNRGLAARSAALLRSNVELMEVLGSAVAKRDSDTDLHNFRVTLYAVRLAQALGISGRELCSLIAGAFLHDVGKIGIADGILRKPGPLSAEEAAIMRSHVPLGLDILSEAAWLESARDVVGCHHERFDGSGYPQGLRGEAIPLDARIFAVADVFDAMTSMRCYKPALPLEQARALIRGASGAQFDPRIVAVFDSIAAQLHRDVGAASERELRAMLRATVARHFLGAPA
jgi:HD-GYP domain-containing protein (c-di-GMP phosphodiesterase class II)